VARQRIVSQFQKAGASTTFLLKALRVIALFGNGTTFFATIARVRWEDNDEIEVCGSIANDDQTCMVIFTNENGVVLGEEVPDVLDRLVGAAGFCFRDCDIGACPSAVATQTLCDTSVDGTADHFPFKVGRVFVRVLGAKCTVRTLELVSAQAPA